MSLFPRLTVAIVCLLGLLQGCSSVNSALGGNSPNEAKAEVSWDFKTNGVQIELMSSADMNAHFNQPHTLVLGVFQLEDAKVFSQLLGDSKQLITTLASGNAGTEVLHLDRYVISPDKRTVLDINRVQGAKYIGLVAGYYNFDASAAARLFRIPLNIQASGIITTSYAAEPANLALRLFLGRERIVNAQSLTFDPDQKPNVETIPLDNVENEIKLNQTTLQQDQDANRAARKLR